MGIVNSTITIPADKIIRQGYNPATPVIGVVTGTIGDGNSIVIKTYGAGAGPTLANIIYDEFDGGVAGNNVDATATVGAWTSVTDGTVTPKYVNDLYGSQLSADAIKADQITNFDKTFASAVTEFFCSYAVKTPDLSYFPYATAEEIFSIGSNWKIMWLLGATGTPDNDLCIPTYSGTNIWSVGGNDVGFFTKTIENGTPSNIYQWDDWNRLSCWLKADPTNPDTVPGSFWFRGLPEGGTQKIVTDSTFSFANGTVPYSWSSFRIGGWHRDQTPDEALVNALIANPYIAWGPGACSRVEIGDNADYESCTKLSICTPTAWADGQVTFTLRKGSHANLTSKYLFLIDEANTVNNIGYPVPA